MSEVIVVALLASMFGAFRAGYLVGRRVEAAIQVGKVDPAGAQERLLKQRQVGL